MEVTFLGANCVRVTGKELAILCDPYGKAAGLPEIKLSGDVTLLSAPTDEQSAKAGMVIDSPGEYEVKGATITGVPASLFGAEEGVPPAATIYVLGWNGLRLAYLGNVAPKLSNDQVEALGEVDVLVLPVGGGDTLDAAQAAGIISQVEPKYVVPTHYDSPDAFLKEIGASSEPQAKLRVSAKDLPAETTVVLLSRQGS